MIAEAGEGSVDDGLLGRVSVDEGEVGFAEAVAHHEAAEAGGAGAGAGDEDDAAGLAVEAVDAGGEAAGIAGEEPIAEGGRAVGFGGVAEEAGGFVGGGPVGG